MEGMHGAAWFNRARCRDDGLGEHLAAKDTPEGVRRGVAYEDILIGSRMVIAIQIEQIQQHLCCA
ncbi:hypothetical protein GCM10010038_03640 [Glutamicibacter protophormiae]|nr:hypothetical protein GCM10010038_03640 [Glutamicibacter protophormiae]